MNTNELLYRIIILVSRVYLMLLHVFDENDICYVDGRLTKSHRGEVFIHRVSSSW